LDRIRNNDDIEAVKQRLGIKEPQFRIVAAKRLAKDRLLNEKHLEHSYKREIGIQSALSSTNIVAVHKTPETEDSLWCVTEFVDGITMRDLINDEQREKADGHKELHPVPALIIAYGVSNALHHLNWKMITHNDLKPSNIMISYEGIVKLLDFGIATGKERLHLTEEEKIDIPEGSLLYRSPEHVKLYVEFSAQKKNGAEFKKVDSRNISSDIFVLGAILYEALTGVQAFYDPSPTMEAINSNILNCKPRPMTNYERFATLKKNARRDVQRIVSTCLQKKRDKRYKEPKRLAEDIAITLRDHFGVSESQYQNILLKYVQLTKPPKVKSSDMDTTGFA